jgi:hypothetical protein
MRNAVFADVASISLLGQLTGEFHKQTYKAFYERSKAACTREEICRKYLLSISVAIHRFSLVIHRFSLVIHRLSLVIHRLSLVIHRFSLVIHRFSLSRVTWGQCQPCTSPSYFTLSTTSSILHQLPFTPPETIRFPSLPFASIISLHPDCILFKSLFYNQFASRSLQWLPVNTNDSLASAKRMPATLF